MHYTVTIQYITSDLYRKKKDYPSPSHIFCEELMYLIYDYWYKMIEFFFCLVKWFCFVVWLLADLLLYFLVELWVNLISFFLVLTKWRESSSILYPGSWYNWQSYKWITIKYLYFLFENPKCMVQVCNRCGDFDFSLIVQYANCQLPWCLLSRGGTQQTMTLTEV